MPLPGTNERYTFADYLEWEEDEHTELIDGVPVMMAPPMRIHQKICGELFRQLANYLDGKNVKSTLRLLESGCLRAKRISRMISMM